MATKPNEPVYAFSKPQTSWNEGETVICKEFEMHTLFENDYVRVEFNKTVGLVEIHHLPFETTVRVGEKDFADIATIFISEQTVDQMLKRTI